MGNRLVGMMFVALLATACTTPLPRPGVEVINGVEVLRDIPGNKYAEGARTGVWNIIAQPDTAAPAPECERVLLCGRRISTTGSLQDYYLQDGGGGRPPRPAEAMPFPDIRDWNTLRINLVRQDCYPACTAYTLEISGDGSVSYEGYNGVRVRGKQSARIAPGAVRDLVAKFREAEFFRLYDRYYSAATDGGATILSVSYDGHSKTVLDYFGLKVDMPVEVRRLQQAVDETAGIQRWAGGMERVWNYSELDPKNRADPQ